MSPDYTDEQLDSILNSYYRENYTALPTDINTLLSSVGTMQPDPVGGLVQPINIADLPSAGTVAGYSGVISPMEAFVSVMGTLNAPAVWGTQLQASYQRNLEGIRGERPPGLHLPEWSNFEEAIRGIYPNPEDVGLALEYRGSWGGLNPAYGIEQLIRGAPESDENQFLTSGRAVLPDTPEEAATIMRGVGQGLAATGHPVAGRIAPWLSGFITEQFAAETMSDPLILLEAFGVGKYAVDGLDIANRAMRGASPLYDTVSRSMNRSILSPLRTASDDIWGAYHRNVYRFSRNFTGEMNWRIENFVGREIAEEQTLREAIGGTWMTDFYNDDIAPRLLGMQESPLIFRGGRTGTGIIPETRLSDVYERMGRGEAVLLDELEAANINVFDYTREAFPEIGAPAQELVADRLKRYWGFSTQFPEAERLMGVPTRELFGDNTFVEHILTAEARRARQMSYPTWREKLTARSQNVLGEELSQTLYKRNLRDSITEYNHLAQEGRIGFIDGRIKILGKGEDVPMGFMAISKLFDNDPRILTSARFSRSTRVVTATAFIREAAQNPAFLGTGNNARRIREVVTDLEYNSTFGRIRKYAGEEISETTENLLGVIDDTLWRNKETAEAIIKYSRVMQGLEDLPGPVLRLFDNVLSLWRGLTLSPFLGYHNRNFIGGALNNFLSGNADIFDMIDAAFATTRKPELLGEFRRAGLHRTGQIHQSWSASFADAYEVPLKSTIVGTQWDKINPVSRRFIGRDVAQAIETHQRLAQYLGSRRRGFDPLRSVENTFTYHFDYADIPPWVQHGTILRRITSFPVWTAKNIPLQLSHMVRVPSRYAWRGRFINLSNRAAGTDPRDMPDFIREGGGFAMPGLEPGSTVHFRPENFDPAAALAEISQPARFVWEMLNPFITTIPEQAMGSVRVGGYNEPGRFSWSMDYSDPAVRKTGYDIFRDRPMVSEYRKWNEAIPWIGGESMDYLSQRVDHVARSFLRAYSEMSGIIRNTQDPGRIKQDPLEYGVRRFGGIPVFDANPMQNVYFELKDIGAQIGRLQQDAGSELESKGENSEETLLRLKEQYAAKLGYLSHVSFMEIDPWTGEPRPWHDIGRENDYNLQGRREYYRDFLETAWLMMYGRPTMESGLAHQPVPLSEDEQQWLEELVDGAVKSYIAIMGGGEFTDEDINFRAERFHANKFLGVPEIEEIR